MQVFVVACSLFASTPSQRPDPLPEFSLPKLDGQILGSQELKDKIIVLNFWATWCTPCVSEIPTFNKLQEKYAKHGVRVIGVAAQSGWASDIQKFVAEYKMHYTVLVGNDDVVADFGIINLPTTYLIRPGWTTYKKYSGIEESKPANFEDDIETLLREKQEN